MKNIIKILVAFLLIVSALLTSCGKKEKPNIDYPGGSKDKNTATEENTQSTDDKNLEFLTLTNLEFITGDLRYTESKQYLGNTVETKPMPMTNQIVDFYKSLTSAVGGTIGTATAPAFLTVPSGKDGRVEIHYGSTGDETALQIIDEVALNEYGYSVRENKIFIYGHTMDELNNASNIFLSDLKKNMQKNDDGTKTYRIPVDTVTRSVNELAIMSVPKPEFGSNKLFCESGLAGERMWVVSGCTTTDYANYLTTLKSASFVEYETNVIEGNLYATYTKDGIIVDVWYTKDGYIRVNASKGYDARPLTASSYTSKGKGPALFMLGKAEEDGGGQECLVFRLSDGRFVIVDSAIPYAYGENIMAFLKKEAPDPNNIVIANWMFTHNHGDHVCGFIGLCQRIAQYKDILTIESFTYNFPGPEQSNVPWQALGISKIPALVSENFPNAKIYRALPGNTFEFADMHVEILASPEFYIYENYPNNTNACNVFYRVTMRGQTINIPGDTSDFDHAKLIELYGDYLQCDILQAPHHGGGGSGTVEAAQKYKPKFILFCHSSGQGNLYGWEDLKNEPYNQQLIDPSKNPNYEEHFVMTDYIYYLPLPYTTGKFVRYTWSAYGM